jgi:23S rRNA (cytidine1920-2'-O)/16S rRNA (cytidine1409-2'-O)-methyltransferase
MMLKQRADQLLVSRGLAASLEKARAMIMAGLVSSCGERVERAGTILDAEAALGVKETLLYVSRAGAKLAQALDAFGVDPAGKVAADVGASTGGFTDCLLRRGARKVYAVDVNTKQLDWRLRRDERVVLVEKNARNLVPGDLKERPDIITLDVSFISILKVLPALKNVLTGVGARAGGSRGEGAGDRARAGRGGRGGEDAGERVSDGVLLALIKPQFEADRGQVGKGGVVRDPAVHAEVLERVVIGAEEAGFRAQGLLRCATRGRTGNSEFFAHFSLSGGRNAVASVCIKEVIGNG